MLERERQADVLASFEAVIDADRAINDAADSHGDGGAAAGGDNALVGCGGAGSWVRGVGTIDKPIFLVGLRAPQGDDQNLVRGAVGGAEAPARSPHPTPAAGVSAEMLTTLPVLTGQDFEFSQTEIRVRVGETVALRLENVDPEYHQFDIDQNR